MLDKGHFELCDIFKQFSIEKLWKLQTFVLTQKCDSECFPSVNPQVWCVVILERFWGSRR